MKVIVHIESDPKQQEMMRSLFERNPIQVIHFPDHDAAKSYLQGEEPCDIVITEIPQDAAARDTYLEELLKQLHNQQRALIVLTEQRDADCIEKYATKGIDGWFTKPASRDNLYLTSLALLKLGSI